jgi:hypothetical protein
MKDPLAKPGASKSEGEDWADQQARHTALKIVVIVLGVVMAMLAVVVLSTLVLRAVKPTGDGVAMQPSPVILDAKVLLPAGAWIVSTVAGEGRIIVVYAVSGRNAALVLDARTLATVGTIEAPAP